MMSLGGWHDQSKTLLATARKCFSGKKIAAPKDCLKKRFSAKKSVFFRKGADQQISPVRYGWLNGSSWAAECCGAVSDTRYAGSK